MDKLRLLMQQNNAKGASVWLAIMNAINDLTTKEQQKYLH